MLRPRWSIAALLWLVASSAAAQSLEPLSFVRGEAYADASELGATPDVKYGSRALATRLRFPVFLDGKDTILLPGFAYQRLELSSVGSAEGERSLALQSPVTEVGVVHRVGERWLLGGFLTAGLASDFEGSVSRDDWSIVGRVLTMYELGESVHAGATVGYDRSTGDFSLVPLLRAAWTVDKAWRFEALLPKAVEVSYRATGWFRAGMKGELDFSRFHLDQARYGVEDLYLEYFAVKAGPTLNFSPAKFLHVDLQAGYAFLRSISAKIDDGSPGMNLYVNSEPAARQIDLAPAPFVAVRLWMGLDGDAPAEPKVN